MSFFRSGKGGGGITQYKKGNEAVPSGGKTITCGFQPKAVFATVLTIHSGATYAGMQVCDSSNGINGFVYKDAVKVKDFAEYFGSGDATIAITSNGFTIQPINPTAWNGATVYYYAIG